MQTHYYGAALTTRQDVLVDGNMGDEKGSATHIRISSEEEKEEDDRFKEGIQKNKTMLESLTEELETHQEDMEKRVKKSTYWAPCIMEKKAPERCCREPPLVTISPGC